MPAIVDWLIEGRVIYHYWWGNGTVDDAHSVNSQTLDMYAQYPEQEKIHIVVDSTKQDTIDVNFTDAQQAYTIINHNQIGWVIIMTNNSLIRMICNAILYLTPVQFRLVRTFDDALVIMKKLMPDTDFKEITYDIITHNQVHNLTK